MSARGGEAERAAYLPVVSGAECAECAAREDAGRRQPATVGGW